MKFTSVKNAKKFKDAKILKTSEWVWATYKHKKETLATIMLRAMLNTHEGKAFKELGPAATTDELGICYHNELPVKINVILNQVNDWMIQGIYKIRIVYLGTDGLITELEARELAVVWELEQLN